MSNPYKGGIVETALEVIKWFSIVAIAGVYLTMSIGIIGYGAATAERLPELTVKECARPVIKRRYDYYEYLFVPQALFGCWIGQPATEMIKP